MTGLDLDSGADIGLTSPDPRFYGMIYEAKHDAPCHVVSFRSDGMVGPFSVGSQIRISWLAPDFTPPPHPKSATK